MYKIEKVILTKPIMKELINLSNRWKEEAISHGIVTNTKKDFVGKDIYVAYNLKNRIVGYLLCSYFVEEKQTPTIPKGSKTCYVDELYVEKRYRCKGIGKLLFEKMQNDIKDRCEYIELVTSTKDYKRIIHFYEDIIGMNFWSASFFKKLDSKGLNVCSNDSTEFVLVSSVIPDVILDIRYYSSFNFVGERIDGYEEPVAILTKQAAQALKKANEKAKELGYRLKIYDCYRPQMAVDHFVRWSKNKNDSMKKYFYPELNKKELFNLGFIASKSSHTRGSTIDLTLFDMSTQNDIDMGGTFDYFGKLSWSENTEDITKNQANNRKLLRNIMIESGFKPLKEEWWHFTLANEPYPNTYFNFPTNSSLKRKTR